MGFCMIFIKSLKLEDHIGLSIIIFKSLVLILKKIKLIFITNLIWLMLFTEKVAVYPNNHNKHINIHWKRQSYCILNQVVRIDTRINHQSSTEICN
jgi:hypothetical protein